MSDIRNANSHASNPAEPGGPGNDTMDFATVNSLSDNARNTRSAAGWPASREEIVAAAIHRAGAKLEAMPADLTRRLEMLIETGIDTTAVNATTNTDSDMSHGDKASFPIAQATRTRSMLPWGLAAAAGIALAATVFVMQRSAATREQALAEARQQIQLLQNRVQENETLLATARSDLSRQSVESAAVAQRELKLAQQLADATRKYTELASVHDQAMVKIAMLEAPVDPVELQKNRTKLLEVPGTVRLAWSPFNLEGAAPAEQPGIKGDVVWNDNEQAGYLRFEGLKPNDPKVEQYQVWVIDERGMEQKVSGGVFNASAAGEIIVPIHPGIDVGRVVLFAITVEKPGGTWVPDLKRRVVVAPRGT